MTENFDVLRRCLLFNGIEDKDLTIMLSCLDAKNERFQKGDTILAEGTQAKYLGIVLTGRAQIERVDYYGNRSILTNIESSCLFGESFASAGLPAMPLDVVSAEDTEVLLIEVKKITQTCNNACAFHSRMIFNLLNIVAKKNIVLNQKIEITSKRSTKEKLMTYLLIQAKEFGTNTFTISYNRQELADYLEVERSGLSAEISKLCKSGVLKCHRSTFTIC